LAHLAEPALELLAAPWRAEYLLALAAAGHFAAAGIDCHAHSRISMPSHATSTPCSASAARSRESSSRIGFVLLIWIRTFRVDSGSAARCSSIPPAPLCGR